jgi:hypothetical protein
VKLHRGEIDVISHEGVGSTFSFTIPFEIFTNTKPTTITANDTNEIIVAANMDDIRSPVSIPSSSLLPVSIKEVILVEERIVNFKFDDIQEVYSIKSKSINSVVDTTTAAAAAAVFPNTLVVDGN